MSPGKHTCQNHTTIIKSLNNTKTGIKYPTYKVEKAGSNKKTRKHGQRFSNTKPQKKIKTKTRKGKKPSKKNK